MDAAFCWSSCLKPSSEYVLSPDIIYPALSVYDSEIDIGLLQ